MKRCMVYLGNGFDVACGLKTKYSQFIESEIFAELEKHCSLARWIKSKYTEDKDRWSDLEELLYEYSLYLRNQYEDVVAFEKKTEKFREEHELMTLALQKYIIKQTGGERSRYIPKLLDSWNESVTLDGVCCFNYTPFSVLFKLLPDYVKLFRVHGELAPSREESAVVVKLGIDRCMEVCPEHSFLYKDNMPIYAPGNWTEPDNLTIAAANLTLETIHPAFHKSDVIIIYGCSLGRSDTAYYKYLFNNANNKKMIIYHYGEKEKYLFRERIFELTNDNGFVEKVVFIDSSINNGYREGFRTVFDTL